MAEDTVRIKLFGSLREFADHQTGEIVIERAKSIEELRENLSLYLHKYFPNSNAGVLVRNCALADEKAVLLPQTSIENREWIAVLPPVCGG